MIGILFWLLMFAIFGKLAVFAFRTAWSFVSVVLTFIFLPMILIGFFLSGLLFLAFPLLIIIGIVSLIMPRRY